jgi:hypothetical protein
MNLAPLYDEESDPTGRYGQFWLGEDELVVYDRENPSAWIRMTAAGVDEGSTTGS